MTTAQVNQDYTATEIELEVVAVYPADGSQACRRPQVGADLRFSDQVPTIDTGPFTEGLEVGPSPLVLSLDGNDVTLDAVITMLRSSLALYSVLYMPTSDLSVGAHSASLAYPSGIGPRTKLWSFTVDSIACGTFYTEPDGGAANSIPE